MAIQIKDLVSSLLPQNDWRITLALRWQEVVGSLQTRIRLEKIFGDTAVIGVYEYHWMQELHLLSSVLCDSMNTFIGEVRIKKVRFILVEDKERVQKRPSAKRWGRPDRVELSKKQKGALELIADEQLRQVLTDFWSRCSVFETQGKI